MDGGGAKGAIEATIIDKIFVTVAVTLKVGTRKDIVGSIQDFMKLKQFGQFTYLLKLTIAMILGF